MPTPRGCLLKGTNITVNNGYTKIENIHVDDIVTSYNVTTNTETSSIVSKVYTRTVDGYFIINGNLNITGEHPVYSNGQWCCINDLNIGDTILTINGTAEVISIIHVIEETEVYNIEVTGEHNYFANDYLVHNKGDDNGKTNGNDNGRTDPITCFLAGTKISTIENIKNIEDVEIGDLVTSYNELNKVKTLSKVVKTFTHTTDQYIVINDTIKITPNHPIYINNEWKQAEALQIGDTLTGEFHDITVDSLVTINSPICINVYNLEVEDTHNYYAEGVLVHNKINPPPPPPPPKPATYLDEKVKASKSDTTGYLDAKVTGSIVIANNKLQLSGEAARPALNGKFYGKRNGISGFFRSTGTPGGETTAVQVNMDDTFYGDASLFSWDKGILTNKSQLHLTGVVAPDIEATEVTTIELASGGTGYTVGDVISPIIMGADVVTFRVDSVTPIVTTLLPKTTITGEKLPLYFNTLDNSITSTSTNTSIVKPLVKTNDILPDVNNGNTLVGIRTGASPPEHIIPVIGGVSADVKIHTPHGWMRASDIQVGDYITIGPSPYKALVTAKEQFKRSSYVELYGFGKFSIDQEMRFEKNGYVWKNAGEAVVGDLTVIPGIPTTVQTHDLPPEQGMTFYSFGLDVFHMFTVATGSGPDSSASYLIKDYYQLNGDREPTVDADTQLEENNKNTDITTEVITGGTITAVTQLTTTTGLQSGTGIKAVGGTGTGATFDIDVETTPAIEGYTKEPLIKLTSLIGTQSTTLELSQTQEAKNITYKLPTDYPEEDDYALTAKTDGTTSWRQAGNPSGLTSAVQLNIGGSFYGDESRLSWNNNRLTTTDQLEIHGLPAASGGIVTMSLVSAGTGYSVNQYLTVVQAGGSYGKIRVDSITGGQSTGPIATFTVIEQGTGYASGAATVSTGSATFTVDTVTSASAATQPYLRLISGEETRITEFVLSPTQAQKTVTYTLPTDYPAADDYVLSSKDNGVLSWVEMTGGGGTCIYKKDSDINVNRNDGNTWFTTKALIDRIDPATIATGYCTISGGLNNRISVPGTARFDFIGGGVDNSIGIDQAESQQYGDEPYANVIAGGHSNSMYFWYDAAMVANFIGGGGENLCNATSYSVISGGYQNSMSGGGGSYSVISGGTANVMPGQKTGCTIGGGSNNSLTANSGGGYSTISGGYGNIIVGDNSVICGGKLNKISTAYYGNSILGGESNTIDFFNSMYNTIIGGKSNSVVLGSGDPPCYCTVGGYNATTNNTKTFVWSDGTVGGSDRPQQVVFYAHGGFKIHTDAGAFEFYGHDDGIPGNGTEKWFTTPNADCYLDSAGNWHTPSGGVGEYALQSEFDTLNQNLADVLDAINGEVI